MSVLRIPDTSCEEVARLSASPPLSLGGLGLRSAVRTSAAAHWASWADTLPMIHQRHPVVATRIVHALAQEVDSPVLGAVRRGAQELEGVSGFVVPSWPALTAGLRPPPREPEFHEPGGPRAGWQHEAASRMERQFRTTSVLPQVSPTRRAMIRSQSQRQGCVLCFPLFSFDAFPASFVPCPSATTPCSSLTFDFAHVRGVGSKRVRRGECRSTGVQRGRRKSCHKSLRERHGLTVCHCLVVCSWQLTPHWCLQCKATENRPGERLTEMVWLSGALADARSTRTPNLSSQGPVPG